MLKGLPCFLLSWKKAKEIKVTIDELPYEPSNGYKRMTSTDVIIKSLHDDKHVYFLITPEPYFQLTRAYGWYSNRMRGDRKKQEEREKEKREGENETIEDSKIIDIRNYMPKRIP